MTGRTPEGKPIYTNIGYAKTRAEGMQMLALFNENPYDVKAKNYTFKDMCEMYFETDKRELHPRTIATRNSYFKMCKDLHDVPIRDLKTLHVQKALDEMPLGLSTKKNAKSLISRVFEYAIQNDIITKNYASYVLVNSDIQPKNERKSFTTEEFLQVWNMKSDLFSDILKMLFFTGFRIKEFLDIKIENVNLDEGYLRGGSKTKAGIDRIVPISQHIEYLIEKHYNPNNEYLFQQQDGKPLSYMRFYKWFVKNIDNQVIHNTRHTFISMISDTDANKVAIQRIVGHASNNVTDSVYTHKTIDSLKKAMVLFDEYIGKIID